MASPMQTACSACPRQNQNGSGVAVSSAVVAIDVAEAVLAVVVMTEAVLAAVVISTVEAESLAVLVTSAAASAVAK